MFAERPLWIELDTDALAHNYAILRRLVGPDVRVIPALKGNAYGHGIEDVAEVLSRQDAHSLAVGSLDDARRIRSVSTLPVLMFGGPLPDGFQPLLDEGFTPTIYNVDSALAISEQAGTPTEVFVKVDAGLGRLGVPIRDAVHFIEKTSALRNIVIGGLYTHLTFYDAAERDWARGRLEAFDDLLARLDAADVRIPVTQALASTGLLTGLQSRANTVCPGSLLYGMCPVDPALCDFSAYRPVFRALKSRLIHIRGDVGVIPLGAAEGMRRVEPEVPAVALIRGQRVPIAGVSLEYTNLDITAVDGAGIGDEVVVIGSSGDESVTLDDVARWWQSNPLHVLLSFAREIPRVASGHP